MYGAIQAALSEPDAPDAGRAAALRGGISADGNAVDDDVFQRAVIFAAFHGGNGVHDVHAVVHLAEHGVQVVKIRRAAHGLIGGYHGLAHTCLGQRFGQSLIHGILGALHDIKLAQVARSTVGACAMATAPA